MFETLTPIGASAAKRDTHAAIHLAFDNHNLEEFTVLNSFRFLGIALVFASSCALAQSGQYLALNVKIVAVAPVSNDAQAFSVTVATLPGGSGYCTPGGAGGSGITFYLSSMPNGDPASLKRIYDTVLLAFSNGYPANIASYTNGSDCTTAAFIQVTT